MPALRAERVMPQHDIAMAGGADVDIAVPVQHPALMDGKDAHVALIGVKVEIPDRPGGHLPIRPRAASSARPQRTTSASGDSASHSGSQHRVA